MNLLCVFMSHFALECRMGDVLEQLSVRMILYMYIEHLENEGKGADIIIDITW